MMTNDAVARSWVERTGERGIEVLGSIAAGRTSMLFLAKNPDLVVVKRPHPGFASDRRALAEFSREAGFAATVHHPNVVGVSLIGDDESGPFFVMDYVEGASLYRLQTLDRDGRTLMTPVPTAISVRIILDVLAGLHAIHEADDGEETLRLVHGDVSPGNILVSVEGASLLTDFGSTCPAGSPPVPSSSGARPRAGYVAPETVLGEPMARSSDIFAVGVVLWELFAGRRLFAAPTPQMVARQVVGGYIPDLATVAPMVPRPIAAACERALAREPHARYATAQQFREELAKAMGESYGPARHDAVAVYLKSRCAGVLAQMRRMIEQPDAVVQSGTRARVSQPP